MSLLEIPKDKSGTPIVRVKVTKLEINDKKFVIHTPVVQATTKDG